MKKFLALLLLSTPCFAGLNVFPILNGQLTNGWFFDPVSGTNKVYVLNAVSATNDFDSTTIFAGGVLVNLTNLGYYVRSRVCQVPVQNVVISMSCFSSSTGQTNPFIYSLQHAVDTNNWQFWTNISYQPTGATNTYTNFTLTVGEFQYIRVYNMSNTSLSPISQGYRSNKLEFYWKSVP